MTKKSRGKSAGGVPDVPPDRNDLNRIGLFSEVGYISTGETYSNKPNTLIPTRQKGRQLLTSPPKRGHDAQSAYFDKEFGRAFQGESYSDIVVMRRRDRLANKKLNIVPEPFKPSSVPQKPSGSGSLFGTIEHSWPLYPQPEHDEVPSISPLNDVPKHETRRNFVTKPGKKGSAYGYPNVTIGESPPYLSDPYDAARQLEMHEQKIHISKMVEEKPFITCGARLLYFDKDIFKSSLNQRSTKSLNNVGSKLPVLPPFRPSGPAKKGLNGTINKYPANEPPKPLTTSQVAKESEESKKQAAYDKLPTFRPVGIPKSYPSKSVVLFNVDARPPPKYVRDLLCAAHMKEYAGNADQMMSKRTVLDVA